MSEKKRYTAQEMREESWYATHNGHIRISTMLQQAADAEEELLKTQREWLSPESWKALFEDCTSKVKEIDKLKSLLEAIQKSLDKHQDCHKCKSYPHCEGLGCICAVAEITNILRAARGEGGAE